MNDPQDQKIYVRQPEVFDILGDDEQIYLLLKALYGFKEVLRLWQQHVYGFLLSIGFSNSYAVPSLYTKTDGQRLIVIVLYVDDLLLT